jgi:maltooligosyltrehalose trehalohydrolase
MPFGAALLADGTTHFRIWAPGAARVDLDLTNERTRADLPMTALPGGWHEAFVRDAPAGTRYAFRINDELTVPDPVSRCNPEDVHAASIVVEPYAYEWRDADWRGRPWEEVVIYEMHVGAFTPAGTFAAVEARLDYLADLGVTAIELMPLADFPGKRNWGYDGVLAFAPESSYGTPEDLKRLIDAAHAHRLMVFLDVVYNHFGPEGNYLHTYAPHFFNPRHQTPWGAAIDFESRPVRDFFVHNALYWLEEFHFDGLRLDAIHAIADDSDPDIVVEIAEAVRGGPGRERYVHLVLENDKNQARYFPRDGGHRPVWANAQWNDDIHHALHVLTTGERDGYYADYASRPLWLLGRCLAEGFAFQGDPSPYREGSTRGEPSVGLPATAFVDFVQTHDQVGNRAFGERIGAVADPRKLRVAVACFLLAPSIPLLFMGEEFSASSPFLFFCDFGPELAAAVTNGRRAEFGRFERFRDPSAQAAIPDPNDPATFAASKLKWEELETPPHAAWHALYRELLGLRHQHIAPRLAGMAPSGRFKLGGSDALAVSWTLGDGARLHLFANFGDSTSGAFELPHGHVLYASHPPGGGVLEPFACLCMLEGAVT